MNRRVLPTAIIGLCTEQPFRVASDELSRSRRDSAGGPGLTQQQTSEAQLPPGAGLQYVWPLTDPCHALALPRGCDPAV
jgi:hypothetical protein